MRFKTVLITTLILSLSSTAALAGSNTGTDMNEAGVGGSADLVINRNVGGQLQWWVRSETGAVSVTGFGLPTDTSITADFDGDGKDDLTVWRPGAAGVAGFYVLLSSTNTVEFKTFGQTGDNATVVGDWNGDGKDDMAVYRPGVVVGAQSTFYWADFSTPTVINFIPWGISGDFPYVLDFDDDGKVDAAVQRNVGGSGQHWVRSSSTGAANIFNFGQGSDVVTAGQFIGNALGDVVVARGSGGAVIWFIRDSQTGAISQRQWGLSATDTLVPADYDNDGIKDLAIWRNGVFWINKSGGGQSFLNWGVSGDRAVATWTIH